MPDRKHPRRFSGEFKRQIAGLVNAGKPLKAEFVRLEPLSDRFYWRDNLRVRSTLGCTSPVEFRKAGRAL